MGSDTLLMYGAVAAGVYLSMGNWNKPSPATVGAAAAVIQLSNAEGWFNFSLGDLPLDQIIPATLAVCGYMLYQRESGKQRLTAAIVLLIAGVLQLAGTV